MQFITSPHTTKSSIIFGLATLGAVITLLPLACPAWIPLDQQTTTTIAFLAPIVATLLIGYLNFRWVDGFGISVTLPYLGNFLVVTFALVACLATYVNQATTIQISAGVVLCYSLVFVVREHVPNQNCPPDQPYIIEH